MIFRARAKKEEEGKNEEKFSLENPKYLENSQYLVENYLSFQSILVKGYPYPLQKKILLQIWMN